MFGIIAGVLVGVWAMYTMLADESDTKSAIAEIEMIQSAAVQFRSLPENGNGYPPYTTSMARIAPYLGEGLGVNGRYGTNIFGGFVTLGPVRTRSLPSLYHPFTLLTYFEVRNMDLCVKILKHFGEVEPFRRPPRRPGDPPGALTGSYMIPEGKATYGYVGGRSPRESGCEESSNGATLNLLID